MEKTRAPIAKITRPNVSGIFQRERLFRFLDGSRTQPITWTTGPPGSGKTTLAASYLDARKLSCLWYQVDERDSDIATFFYYLGLAAQRAAPRFRNPLPHFTPEYMHGITAFTRRYFENLYHRLKTPFVLVFDNYQDVPADSRFHEVMREGLSVLPEGIRVILLSRSDPPPTLARLLASSKIAVVGWDALKFDLPEADALIRIKTHKRLPDDVLQQLHARLEGWAAGLVLSIQRMKKEKIDLQSLGNLRYEEIFNYFASEIFERTDEETREFLLKTSFLPKMTTPITEMLTGFKRADEILSELSRRHYFTGIHTHGGGNPVYQYHPLFRDFLMSRAQKTFDRSAMNEMQLTAARLLAESGQIEDAAELYHKAGNIPGLAMLILEYAQVFITQGRHRTLGTWISWMPEEEVYKNPWLLFWLSLSRLPFDPGRGRTLSEKAYELFRGRNDITGMFMSCYPAVGAICYEQTDYRLLDRWIAILESIFREVKVFPSPEIEVRSTNSLYIALLLRRPDHEDIQKYLERFCSISRGMHDVNLRIQLEADTSLYYLWTGDFVKAFEVIDTLLSLTRRKDISISPLPFVLLKTYEAMYHAFLGAYDSCHDAVEKGLEMTRTSGVNIMYRQLMTHAAAATLGKGDLDAAAGLLKELEGTLQGSQRVIIAYYHYMKAWHALLSEDLHAAYKHISEALSVSTTIGLTFLEALVHYAVAQIQFQRGQYRDARSHLNKTQQIGRAMKSHILEFTCLLARAQFSLHEGRQEEAETLLRRALVLGKKRGYTFFLFWQPSVMAQLCAVALDAGIEAPYVRDIIRRRNLVPDISRKRPDNWPWPVKAYTLGRFSLHRDGEQVNVSGKAQKKPLDMLKALIAFGGRDVSEDRITDALWPDAEGDLAHKSFEITLHRLRKLCGTDKGVQLQEGKLTLDPRHCWVDAWALERCISEAEEAWKQVDQLMARGRHPKTRNAEADAVRLTDKTIGLYNGHFLPGDTNQPWTISYRERLRSKFIRMILKLGKHQEHSGKCEESIECYQKGLEIDSLAEEFYQRLMECYQDLGQQAAGIDVYRRCREILSSALGITPSAKTETIYRNLKERTGPRRSFDA